MAYTPSELQTALDNIKDTVSGKVEYNDAAASLKFVLGILQNMALNNMIFQVESIDAMTALSGTDANFVQVQAFAAGASAGIYSYRAAGVPNGTDTFAATGGGVWRKAELANQS